MTVSAFHAAIASTLMGLGVGMTMIGRAWPAPGRHRGRRGGVSDGTLLDGLFAPRVRVGWLWCVSCCRNEQHVPVGDVWACTHCHETTHTTGSTQ